VDDSGNILLKPLRLKLLDIAGMFKADHPVPDEEIRKAIEDGYAGRRGLSGAGGVTRISLPPRAAAA
jgi:hypothetical protein